MNAPPKGKERHARRPAPCPVCGGPAARAHRPFCSRRCADVDLGRWLKGAYAIAGDPVPDGDAAEAGGARDAQGAGDGED